MDSDYSGWCWQNYYDEHRWWGLIRTKSFIDDIKGQQKEEKKALKLLLQVIEQRDAEAY